MSDERCMDEIEPGLRCDREAGHDGPHHIEGRVPSFVGKMLDQAIGDYETATENYNRAARRAGISAWGYLIALAALLLLLAANILASALPGDPQWIVGVAVGVPVGVGLTFLAHRVHVILHLRRIRKANR